MVRLRLNCMLVACEECREYQDGMERIMQVEIDLSRGVGVVSLGNLKWV